MGLSLLWVQSGGCGGDTMSFLSSELPNVADLLTACDVSLLWHPSLSAQTVAETRELFDDLSAGRRPLDILVVEGSQIFGPNETGGFDQHAGQPKIDLVRRLAHQAKYVLAAGTCAAFGGIGVGSETDARGLQFTQNQPGGLLPADFRAASGLPVINLAGCPAHPAVVAGALTALSSGTPLALDQFQRPLDWYGTLVHQGCTRNEYHEYRVEETEFGQNGCLFFFMGCHGPLVGGPCNKTLWNERSSKTRAGVPCFGCTDPSFPQSAPMFETRNIAGVPVNLPRGIDRAHYLAYKSMAAAAAPQRLLDRRTKI